MVNERQQNLADGNQIADRHTTMAYRDSAGRTRQEVIDAKGELKLVTIHDPVAGATWILKPQDHTATKLAGLGEAERQAMRKAAEAGRKAGEAAHARVEQMRKDGTLPTSNGTSGRRQGRDHRAKGSCACGRRAASTSRKTYASRSKAAVENGALRPSACRCAWPR